MKIPVIGNGDVFSGEDALAILRETACDGIMVARGARGNPFIFEELRDVLHGSTPRVITAEERIMTAIRHIELNAEYGGAFVSMRKHIAWYTRGLPNSARIREEVNACPNAERAREILTECLQ